jgi:hypothetical protein
VFGSPRFAQYEPESDTILFGIIRESVSRKKRAYLGAEMVQPLVTEFGDCRVRLSGMLFNLAGFTIPHRLAYCSGLAFQLVV